MLFVPVVVVTSVVVLVVVEAYTFGLLKGKAHPQPK